MNNVDVLAVMDRAYYAVPEHQGDLAEDVHQASKAVANMIEREKVAQQVLDCILRGVNDLGGEMGHRSTQYVDGWVRSWARTMLAAGFTPSNPRAGDIKRGIARVQGGAA